MKKKINVLLVGLGSIGQRHLRNLSTIFGEKIRFFAYRKKNKKILLNNFGDKIKGNVEKKYKIILIRDLEKLDNNKIDIVFITNPSSLHIQTIIKFKKFKNKYFFIEKPLDSTLDKYDKFINFIKKKKIETFIGYNLRFHPCVKKAKEILNKRNKLGKILQAHFYYGDNLKNWHKYENYKTSYASNKKLGGGIVLSAIHEFDLMFALFENAQIIQSYNDHLSDLKINVEDFSISVFKNNYRKNKIISVVMLNFFQLNKERYVKIIFEKGLIYLDLLKFKVSLFEKDKFKHFQYKKNNNLMYLNELKFFLSFYQNKKKIPKEFNYINGLKTLKLALKVKNYNLRKLKIK